MIRWLAPLLLASSAPALPQSCPKAQVNLLSGGAQPDGNTYGATISGNGRYMAWTTDSPGVLPGLSGGANDVFLTDLETGAIEFVSVALGGGDSNGACYYPTLSSSGRRVAFYALATNLVATPPSTSGAVYVRDLDAGTTSRVDVTPSGGAPNFPPQAAASISPCGRYVAFSSRAQDIVPGVPGLNPNQAQIYLRDLAAGTTVIASTDAAGTAAENDCYNPTVLAGGRFVLFDSYAVNLDPPDSNGNADVYLKDLLLGTVERISVNTAGQQKNKNAYDAQMSADARFVVFESAGQYVPGTPLGVEQIYVRDRVLGTTTLVSEGATGVADDHCEQASISSCGRFVVFSSLATTLWPGNTNGNDDVYLRDLSDGSLRLLSLEEGGAVPVGRSYTSQTGSAFSADGRSILFLSKVKNLTAVPDPNGNTDVFIEACPLTEPATYCAAEVNSLGCTPAIGSSGVPSASAASGFLVTCDDALSQRAGLFYYGLAGPNLLPFQGGLRCVEAPVRRTPLTTSGGSASLDCSGVFSIDFNAWIAGGSDPALVASQRVWGQWWSRDSGSSFSTNLSDAIVFELVP